VGRRSWHGVAVALWLQILKDMPNAHRGTHWQMQSDLRFLPQREMPIRGRWSEPRNMAGAGAGAQYRQAPRSNVKARHARRDASHRLLERDDMSISAAQGWRPLGWPIRADPRSWRT
jgi:hypothetical protein